MIALVAILIAAVAIGIGSWQVAAGSSVPAPSLISLTADAATARAAEDGLAVRFAEPGAYDEAMPAGQVLSTDPPAGENVRKNGTITATLSLGPERYDVPELAGLRVDDARDRLAENNLVLGDDMTREYSDSIEQGDVIRTNPEGGTALPRDSVIEVVVSRGVRPVELPDVVGQSLDEATDLLSRLGFDIGDTDTEFADAPAGQVISQDPGPDRRATRGQSVDLVVSRGPELVTVPSVVGMDADEAVEVLEDAGLEVEVDDFPGNFGDQVVAQDPDPGTQVPPGTTVRISVF